MRGYFHHSVLETEINAKLAMDAWEWGGGIRRNDMKNELKIEI